MDCEKRMEWDKKMIEVRLAEFFTGDGLEEAMRYSLLAGGKRIRPILVLEFCRAAGGEPEDALDFACAVEMLHTYSLIHDDLPCMDNDDLRRGKPTCHKKFGEATAVLAGDALQAAAFRTILAVAGGNSFSAEKVISALYSANVLAGAVGSDIGMCQGQYEDTVGGAQGSNLLEKLQNTSLKKTGALIATACSVGVSAAAPFQNTETLRKCSFDYGTALGLAFQVRDDMLDVTGGLGRPAGSDAANGKLTFASILGTDACAGLVRQYTQQAKDALTKAYWPGGTEFLCWLADELAYRNK